MALKDDPKVQELIAKAVAKAQKSTLAQAVASIKQQADDATIDLEDAAAKKTIKAFARDVVARVKDTSAAE